MDDENNLFENLGRSIVEYKPEPTNPATIRSREHRERVRTKLQMLEQQQFPDAAQDAVSYALRIINDPSEPHSRKDRLCIALLQYEARMGKEAKLLKGEQRAIAAREASLGRYKAEDAPNVVVLPRSKEQT